MDNRYVNFISDEQMLKGIANLHMKIIVIA